MWIKIRGKLAPFSHRPGVRSIIPQTTWEIEAFPTLIRLRNLAGEGFYEHFFHHRGPVKNFTLQTDLDRGLIKVFGHAPQGYFCKILKRKKGQLFLDEAALPMQLEPFEIKPLQERISFGQSKMQDWDFMKKRLDPLSIWPLLIALSQQLPSFPLEKVGSAIVLEEIAEAEKIELINKWQVALMGCFQELLVPSYIDPYFQGLFKAPLAPIKYSTLGIIHFAASLIRSYFFREESGTLFFLPKLPPQCHAGRFIDIQTNQQLTCHLEWSKKEIKKVLLHAKEPGALKLDFPREVKSFRLRRSLKEKGIRVDKFYIEYLAGDSFFLDRFL